MPKNEYTHLPGIGYVCNDCGADGVHINEIVHYPNCEAGSSRKWEAFYNQMSPEEEDRLDKEYAEYLKRSGR